MGGARGKERRGLQRAQQAEIVRKETERKIGEGKQQGEGDEGSREGEGASRRCRLKLSMIRFTRPLHEH